MAYDNNAVRRGQAINLAVNDAIANNKQDNPKYIYKKFLYYMQIADVLQGSDQDLIQQVIDSKDFDKVIEQIAKVMK